MQLKFIIVKLVAFCIRILTLSWSLLLSIATGMGVINYLNSPSELSSVKQQQEFINYVLFFISGLVIIFPFRLIKNIRYLKLYFRLLLMVSIGLIFGTILVSIEFKKVPLTYEIFLLIANFIVVHFYLRHRQNPQLFNPLPGKRIFKFLLIIFLCLLILSGYLFLDIRNTPRGKIYYSIPSIIPQVEAQFTQDALNSDYKLGSFIYTDLKNNLPLSISIKKQKVEGEDFIEIYEENQKIFRIDFNQEGVRSVYTYDKDQTIHQYTGQSIYEHSYKRLKDGRFTTEQNTSMKQLDLLINKHVTATEQTNKIEELEIEIQKSIDFPKRSKFIPLPFVRSSTNWNLSVEDSKENISLINQILLWY